MVVETFFLCFSFFSTTICHFTSLKKNLPLEQMKRENLENSGNGIHFLIDFKSITLTRRERESVNLLFSRKKAERDENKRERPKTLRTKAEGGRRRFSRV